MTLGTALMIHALRLLLIRPSLSIQVIARAWLPRRWFGYRQVIVSAPLSQRGVCRVFLEAVPPL
jgi:hypothetical protein